MEKGNGILFEFGEWDRDLSSIEKGIDAALANQIRLVIGAGGASVMDAAKLIAFGVKHPNDLRDYIFGGKSPYHKERLPLALILTYPSSGSEYGLGAVSFDPETGETGTAYGIAADAALLCPKYSYTLNAEMTAYTGLVTLVQLSAAVIGDANPMSYDAGVSYMRNVLKAVRALQDNPMDEDARGIILIGAAMSTSSRLGLEKKTNYAYDIYGVEEIPERLFHSTYRQALTSLFPSFLERMAQYHEEDIKRYFKDVYDYQESVQESAERLRKLFESFGVNMHYDQTYQREDLNQFNIDSELTRKDIESIIRSIVKGGIKWQNFR